MGIQIKYPELRDKNWWKKNWIKSNGKLAKELGCSLGTVHVWRRKMGVSAYKQSPHLIGKEAEDFVAGRIIELGGEVARQDIRAPFDLSLGDIRIDVKSASPKIISNAHPSPYYSFTLGKSQHTDCDFYVLVAKHPEDWACFVIPSSVVEIGKSTMSFRWPAHHPKTNSWARYLERWDLLDLLE